MVSAVSLPARVPPGPSSWPVVGNLLDLRAAGDLVKFSEPLWRKHGDVFRFKLLGTPVIAVAHPEALKRILSSQREKYVKGKMYDSVRSVLGDSLVPLDGDAWKARRALMQPSFHRRELMKLTAIMAETGARFFDGLLARADGGVLEIDAHRQMVQVTLDVVLHALLGGDLIRSADVDYESISQSIELMSEAANGVVLPAWVPTPYNIRFRRTMRELDGLMYTLIQRARALRSEDGSLLSMMLSAVDADTGKSLPDKAIRDEVFTMFIAGHETTALTLTWMFVLLDGRPDVLRKMRDEVDSVLPDRDPTFDDVPKMPYLRQVVSETLRLRPPAPLVARSVVEDDVIGDYTVKAGEAVWLLFWATHRHPEFWPDADAFDPDRFSPERSADRHTWSYMPFSGGPRTCIGNMFALVEASILIAQLLRRFDVEVQSCADVMPVTIATTRPSRPVHVVLRRRGERAKSS
jgi:cytochrome P450